MIDKREKDKQLYILAILNYKKKHPKIDNQELFPSDFYLNQDYHLKVEIIAEAIQKGIRVEDTDGYQNNFVKL